MADKRMGSAQEAGKQPAHKSKKRHPVISILIIPIVLAAAGYLGYLGYQQLIDWWGQFEQRTVTLQARFAELDTRLAAQQQALDALYAGQERLPHSLDELYTGQEQLSHSLDELYARQERLSYAMADRPQLSSAPTLDFMLAELGHLLLLASQRLALDQDVVTALSALEIADQRMTGLQGLDTVREQLHQYMAALRAVKRPDSGELALYFADMMAQVERLALRMPTIQQQSDQADDGQGQAAAKATWLQTLWQALKQSGFVSIRPRRELTAFFPEERYYIYQNLRSELANARMAALNKDTANLRRAIQLLLAWLDSYFDPDSTEVAHLMNQLEGMQAIELAPALPDINPLREALRRYIRASQDQAAPDQVLD